MFARASLARLCAWALVLPGAASAEAAEYSVRIDGGPLGVRLKDFERQTGVELLYDGEIVRGLEATPVAGKLATEAALHELISATGLTVRRASSGAWIIERKSSPPLAQQDVPVAEILVVGRRTQNADIRRFENDVQPYVVATQDEIVRAHRDGLDQFFASRVTANTTTVPSLASQDAAVMSTIDLRGLGHQQTVVLVDGRRMPLLPDSGISFRQSDLNAIPLHAIERVEVLTGAAGGIHGFGALGGVVNVVLDRDIDGLDLFTTQGISSRGDARRHGFEARFGQRFNDGATDFMLFASHQELDTLRAGERQFALRDRRHTFELAPDYYGTQFRTGNSLTVSSLFRVDPDTSEVIPNPELTFKPGFGGQPLGAAYTYLPTGFGGDSAALGAVLRENAGARDFSLDRNEAATDIGPNPRSDALLANFRHRFDSGWETYADVVMLRSHGESAGRTEQLRSGAYTGTVFMAPESPANPFNEFVAVTYPVVPLAGGDRSRIDNSRYSAGVEGKLPRGWRGNLEASWGRLRYRQSVSDSQPLNANFFLSGDPSDLDTNPLGHWSAFEPLIGAELFRYRLDFDFHSRFQTQSLRLAGPVFETRAAPATLTLLAERRSDRIPGSEETFFTELDSMPSTETVRGDPRARDTRSFYAELRTRLFDETARVAMVRGLELQVAARHDQQQDDFASDPTFPGSEILHSKFGGMAYTLGASITPARWLMLRGSYATGEQPPPSISLAEREPITAGLDEFLPPDPKRGDTAVGLDAEFLLYREGNSGLRMARASTLFLGAVLSPLGADGPSVALDYARVHRTRDLSTYVLPEILAHEDAWPGRVVRAPLTDADRANGYTGGIVTMIDTRVSNDGALDVEAIDLRAEWPLSLLGGRLRLYADATYQKHHVRTQRFQPEVLVAGYRDAPLRRRANGGFDWSKDGFALGANLQYFGSSLITGREDDEFANADSPRIQGSTRVASQTYLDLHGRWRLPLGDFLSVDSLTIDLGIVNVLDEEPPREHYYNTIGPGFSRYGDPRLRRFELGVSCRF